MTVAAADFEREALAAQSYLMGFAMNLTGNRMDAEDLVQETFLKGFLHQASVRHVGHVRAWLATILRNTYLDLLKHRHRWGYDALTEDLIDEGDPEARLCDLLEADDVVAAIDGLPPCCQAAIRRYEIDGYSTHEIAADDDITVGAAKMRVYRGRVLLRNRLRARTAA